jgi:hypothetical protein
MNEAGKDNKLIILEKEHVRTAEAWDITENNVHKDPEK